LSEAELKHEPEQKVQRNVGLFVDLKNLSSKVDLRRIDRFAASFGRVTVKRVYMPGYNWRLAKHARSIGLEPVLVSGTNKESVIDAVMIVDMMDEGFHDRISTVVVVSGDGDFEPAVRRLREEGKFVVVVSPVQSLSRSLLSAADRVEPYGCLSATQGGLRTKRFENSR